MEYVLSRLTLVTVPENVCPSKASAETSTFCPTFTFLISSSSMDISNVRLDKSYMVARTVVLELFLVILSPTLKFFVMT